MTAELQESLIVPRVANDLWYEEEAACKLTPDNFELEYTDGSDMKGRAKVLEEDRLIGRYCLSCKGLWNCRAEALKQGDRYGVRGGLSGEERVPLILALRENGGLTQAEWTTGHTFARDIEESPEVTLESETEDAVEPEVQVATTAAGSASDHWKSLSCRWPKLVGSQRPVTAGEWVEIVPAEQSTPLTIEQVTALTGTSKPQRNVARNATAAIPTAPVDEVRAAAKPAAVEQPESTEPQSTQTVAVSLESLRSRLQARRGMLAELRKYPGPRHETKSAHDHLKVEIAMLRAEIEQTA